MVPLPKLGHEKQQLIFSPFCNIIKVIYWISFDEGLWWLNVASGGGIGVLGKLSSHGSDLWKGIWLGRGEFWRWINFNVGGGPRVRFWTDWWCGE